MIELLRRALQRHERSKDAARQRLQLILVLDRLGISTESLDGMKRDLLEVVSRYLVVEEESIELDMQRSGSSLVLVSNIQVKDIVRAARVAP